MGSDQGNDIKASIDIGSNTVLALAGKVHDEKVIPLLEMQEAPRLGEGVDEEKRLDPDAVRRVIEALLNFKKFFKLNYPQLQDVKVMATSAVRDAQNKQAFVDQIEKETGYKTNILSGEEEARLMYHGAKSVLPRMKSDVTAIDIGGGSTELAIGNSEELINNISFDMGSVRFTERYLTGNPSSEKEIEACRMGIKQMLEQRTLPVNNDSALIGIAGTLTSIASIDAGLQTYQPKELNGYKLTLTDVSNHTQRMSTCTKEQLLERYPNILKGRAGVILGGLLILETFMTYYELQTVTISTGGIRHGALLMD